MTPLLQALPWLTSIPEKLPVGANEAVHRQIRSFSSVRIFNVQPTGAAREEHREAPQKWETLL